MLYYWAELNHARGQLDDAIAISYHILDTRLRKLGPHDLDTLVSLKDRGRMLYRVGRSQEASNLMRKALAFRHIYPEGLIATMMWYTSVPVLMRQQEWEVAETICLNALELATQKRSRKPPYCLALTFEHGRGLMVQRRYTEAYGKFSEAYEGWEKIFGPTHRLSILSAETCQKALDEITSNSLEAILPNRKEPSITLKA